MIIQFSVVPFRRKDDGTLKAGEVFDMPDFHAARRFAEALMLVREVVGAVVTERAGEVAGSGPTPRLLEKYGEVDLQALAG